MRPRRLVFAGQAIVDIVLRVPALPERGGDMIATSAEITTGGGFNVMAAAARQGLPVLYAGGHGTGPWGDLVRAALAVEGITILRPADPGRDTGFDVALVEPDGERTFATHPGAETLNGGWPGIPMAQGDVVYLSGYGLPRISPLPSAAQVFVDPGPLAAQIPADLLDPVLARCDWLSCNQREAGLLTGSAEPVAAARLLLGRTDHASVIVRTGASGCVLAVRGGEMTRVPAPVVRGRRHDGRRRHSRRRVHRRSRRRAVPGAGRCPRQRCRGLLCDPPGAGDVSDPRRPGRVAGGEARVVRGYVVSAW